MINLKTLVAVMSILIAMSCGKAKYHDPEVSAIVAEFEQDYSQDTSMVEIDIVDIGLGVSSGNTIVGNCNSSGLIKLNRSFFESFSTEQKRNLVFHELGHCIFSRQHTEAKLPDGCPASLMYPSVLSTACLRLHEVEYTGELPNK